MPDIADVAWSEHDERNSEAVPNGWPTGAFPAYTDLVGQMMMGATKRFWNKINPVYQTSGTGDNYVVQTEIGIDQINLYEILCIRIDRSNTTSTPTLQFGATNARTIVKAGPSGYVPLAAGDMFAGNSHTFWYNGAFYILVDPAVIVGGNVQPYSPNLTSWAAITRATGFDTWVASPTSANLAALVGDETGTGALVFGTGPTLSAPLLAGGTSGATTLQASANASGTLTLPAATDTLVGKATTDTLINKTISGVSNTVTNIPIGTGISGLGTGVATALGINVGTSGSFVINGGALGTPSSGVAANLTGLPLTTGVTGTLGIGNGGTGQTSANAALNALLPSQTGKSMDALVSDGTNTAWVPIPIGYVGGRLTLTSGTPLMTATVTGATTVYWTPWRGQYVPLYDGTKWQTAYYSAELSQALTDATKSPAAAAANSIYDIFFWNDAGTYRISRGPAWSSSSVRGAAANIFRLNGVYVNVSAITNGPAASQGTYLGTIATNASATVDFTFGGLGSGGVAASLNVWNNYNRILTSTFVFDTGTSYTYTSTTIRQARASTGNQVGFLCGLREDNYTAFYQQNCQTVAAASATCLFGLGVNSTTVYAVGNQIVAPTAAAFKGGNTVLWTVSAQIGTNIIAAIESSDGTNANSFCVFGGAQISFSFPM